MNVVDWDESFSVNIETIDSQHKKLFQYINDTLEALKQNDVKKALVVIDRLYDYTVEHFGVEEAFFKVSNYEQTAEHLARHKLFTERIKYFKKNIEKDFEKISMEMVSYISGWLIGHIMTYDKEYAPHWIEYYKDKKV